MRVVQSLLLWLPQRYLISHYFLYMAQVSHKTKVETCVSFSFCLSSVYSLHVNNTKAAVFHLHGKQSVPKECVRNQNFWQFLWEFGDNKTHTYMYSKLVKEITCYTHWNYFPFSAIKVLVLIKWQMLMDFFFKYFSSSNLDLLTFLKNVRPLSSDYCLT